ncbi:MAG: adenosylcobinamide-phosphate synthase CbiB [Cyanobacteriota bacterium]|nr:adenosylcobinamide-phosphate synthase CbiB [Cyanobacteriota bacterium]
MAAGGSGAIDHPALVVVLACGLDHLLGDPRAMLHPVQVMGWCIQRLRSLSEGWAADSPWKLRLSGGLISLLIVLGSAGVGWQLERWAHGRPVLGTVGLVVALASALAGGSLERAVGEVLQALPDLGEARARLAWIVGREVAGLPETEIVRAAAETTAENAVDGLFAPLFWIMVGVGLNAWQSGGPGPLALAWAFKASSTLDSMLGYRQGRLRWLGTAGARLDDVLTWIPARLVALTLPLVSHRPWRCWPLFQRALREGAADPSPNAGVSQAAYAHAVGVRLGGKNRYASGWRFKPVLGSAFPLADRQAVERMLRLTRQLELLWLLVFVVILAGWRALGGG